MSDEKTAVSPEVLETLKTIIAPGRRVRISPFVEAAQFQVLFGTRPDFHFRRKSARRILSEKAEKIESIAAKWATFTADSKRFGSEVYTESFLQSYLAYYFTVNVGKIQLALLEMAPYGVFSQEMVLVDVGVGCGTTFVAALDFLSGWSQACRFHNTRLPVKALRLLGMDANPACLDMGKRVVAVYGDILAKAPSHMLSKDAGPDELKNIAGWALKSEWQMVNLNHQAPEIPADRTVLFGSNLFNELQATGKQNLACCLKVLGPESAALVIEPGDEKKTQKRKSFLEGIFMQRKQNTLKKFCQHFFVFDQRSKMAAV